MSLFAFLRKNLERDDSLWEEQTVRMFQSCRAAYEEGRKSRSEFVKYIEEIIISAIEKKNIAPVLQIELLCQEYCQTYRKELEEVNTGIRFIKGEIDRNQNKQQFMANSESKLQELSIKQKLLRNKVEEYATLPSFRNTGKEAASVLKELIEKRLFRTLKKEQEILKKGNVAVQVNVMHIQALLSLAVKANISLPKASVEKMIAHVLCTALKRERSIVKKGDMVAAGKVIEKMRVLMYVSVS